MSGAKDKNQWREDQQASKAWGVILFGLIGAAAATIAVGQLRRTVDLFYSQLRSRSASWSNGANGSTRGGFREEAANRYRKRMQEELEDELERVERIRRMQSVFNRERSKVKRNYESWRDNDFGNQNAYQHIPRDDWYYKTDSSYREQRSYYNYQNRPSGNRSMSHHYTVLGLNRSRQHPYSEEEVKKAFRAKAMEYHPDQNRENKESAEAKFKEVMASYEAIKLERKNKH